VAFSDIRYLVSNTTWKTMGTPDEILLQHELEVMAGILESKA